MKKHKVSAIGIYKIACTICKTNECVWNRQSWHICILKVMSSSRVLSMECID